MLAPIAMIAITADDVGRYEKPEHIGLLMRLHHDAKMRITIDLPDDLHKILASLAVHTRKSLSQTATELIRRGLAGDGGASATVVFSTHPVTGLPVLHLGRLITAEDVKALDDEE